MNLTLQYYSRGVNFEIADWFKSWRVICSNMARARKTQTNIYSRKKPSIHSFSLKDRAVNRPRCLCRLKEKKDTCIPRHMSNLCLVTKWQLKGNDYETLAVAYFVKSLQAYHKFSLSIDAD